MKIKLIFVILLFFQIVSFAQIQVDTILRIDSILRNDTLFIVKTKHITYTINDSTSNFAKIIKNTSKKLTNLESLRDFNFLKKEIKFKPNFSPIVKRYIGFHFSPVFNIYNSESEFQNTYFFINNFLGYGLSAYSKNFVLSSGLYFNYMSHLQIVNDKWEDIENSVKTYVNHNYLLDIDTIWFLDLDSLLHGDTVYIAYYDSNYIETTDTFYVAKSDTTRFNLKNNNVNSAYFIAIPLIFSKYFKFKRANIFLSGGAIFKYNLYSNIYLYSSLTHNYKKVYYSNFQLNINAAISGEYFFVPSKMSGVFRLYANKPIFNDFKFIELTNNYKFGFSIGLKYYF